MDGRRAVQRERLQPQLVGGGARRCLGDCFRRQTDVVDREVLSAIRPWSAGALRVCELDDRQGVSRSAGAADVATGPHPGLPDPADLVEQQDKFNRLLPSINDENFKFTLRTDAGQILFAHTVNGREVREMITASILFSETQMADVMNPGRVGMVIFNGVPVSVVYSRAPAGQLNARLSDVVTKSITPTAEWSRRTFQYNMKKQQDAFERMMADARYREEQRRQMFQAHQQKMADMQASQAQRDKLYDQKNLASDRTQREFIEAVRGVETYHEPVEGGVVQLDNTFNHAWRVRDGSYLLTDDPNFRPGLVGLEGQELRRVQ